MQILSICDYTSIAQNFHVVWGIYSFLAMDFLGMLAF